MSSQRLSTKFEENGRDSPHKEIKKDVSFKIGKEWSCEDIEDSVVYMEE